MSYRLFQPELEAMPRQQLEALQMARLQRTLAQIGVQNRRYARHLGNGGRRQLNSPADLQEYPFLTKDDLRLAYPFGLACRPETEFVRLQMSSGTTGTPIICPYTAKDVGQWGEIGARCLTAAGLQADDVLQITPSFGLFNGGFGFHYGASMMGAMIIPIGAGRTQLQLKFMCDLGTTAIAAIASYPLRLMEIAAEEGFDFRRDTRLRVGIFGAEIWSDELRRRIEDVMGIEAFDIIGMTESGGVGMGIDCPLHEGVHVWEDHYLVEFVDPNGDELVADGKWGEMVVTTLTREALPLIRFRTRDISRVISRGPCGCGRTSLRIERIACRNDDMLKVKGVNFYPKQVESLLMRHRAVGNNYLIEIDRVAGADQMRISVEMTDDNPGGLAEQLSKELYNLIGLHAEIVSLPLGGLPRTPGKAIRVKDRRNYGH